MKQVKLNELLERGVGSDRVHRHSELRQHTRFRRYILRFRHSAGLLSELQNAAAGGGPRPARRRSLNRSSELLIAHLSHTVQHGRDCGGLIRSRCWIASVQGSSPLGGADTEPARLGTGTKAVDRLSLDDLHLLAAEDSRQLLPNADHEIRHCTAPGALVDLESRTHLTFDRRRLLACGSGTIDGSDRTGQTSQRLVLPIPNGFEALLSLIQHAGELSRLGRGDTHSTQHSSERELKYDYLGVLPNLVVRTGGARRHLCLHAAHAEEYEHANKQSWFHGDLGLSPSSPFNWLDHKSSPAPRS